MKLLGIDYGRRRIGIASTDDTGICIRGCTTIDQKKNHDPLATLTQIITDESPEALIFGIPLGPHDEETVMSREIRTFAEHLRERLPKKLPVYFVDESFSTIQSQHLQLLYKKKQRRDKGHLDRISACIILEIFQRQQQCDRG